MDSPLDALDGVILGERPSLTRIEVCERAEVPLEVAVRLWGLLGFAHVDDDEVVFTPADAEALRAAQELVDLGILGPERQAALVRTWGHSFARLAEWQTGLLATVAAEQDEDPLAALADQVLPRVEALQSYVWRRHLVGAAGRLLAAGDPEAASSATLTVGFVDIVGYTARSKELTENELVAWLEDFESATTARVTEADGQVIKSIGDEVLFVADPTAAAHVALDLVGRGEDDDAFPRVRAGLAHGEVVRRLGDVYGETVNVASRLTSAARPGTVLVDRGVHDVLSDDLSDQLELRRVRRLSVKGYARLEAWALRSGWSTP